MQSHLITLPHPCSPNCLHHRTDSHQALPQPAYRDNWWAQPPLPNSFQWEVDATGQQMKNNLQSYPAKGWTTYPDGTSANAQSEANIVPINDWVPGQEPAWAPIAGGKGYGTPERSHGPPSGGSGSHVGSANSKCSSGSLASGVPSSKRDGGGDWMLAAGKRIVNGITYINPTGWDSRAH